MKNGRSPHFYLAIFWFLVALTAFCSGATPERPYYSETPNPRHIQNNDRLTAEYFNNQLNVIYNWAQRTHTELDNLLHNGIGVASLTVGILNCTNKIINPEWDNLLHNGNGVASITANLVKTQNLEISNKIDVPAIEFTGRSQPNPPVNNGMLYFDSDLQRFRVYQEDSWRDLSSNFVIASDSLTNPLVIQGYISASNIYATNSAVINKNLTVKGGMKIPVASNTSLGAGSLYYDPTDGKVKVLNEDGEWEIVGDDSTSIEEVDNRIESINTNMLASLSAGLNAAEASATALVNNASSSLNSQFNTAISNASSSLNTQFNNAITAYSNNLKSYIDAQDDKTLASGTKKFITKIETGDNNGTIKYTKNGSTTNVSVKGLGTAAYTASGTYVTAIAQGDNDGTIKYTKNGTSYNIPVKGLGSAAYANVASFSTAGAANSIPTSPQTNPVVGSIYWNTSGNYLRIYTGSSWKNFYPQESASAVSNESYVQNAMHSWTYISGGSVRYDFIDGTAVTPDNQTCYYPILQESNNGTTFTNVQGYQRGHCYCVGHERVSSDYVKVTVLFPVSSLGTYHYVTKVDIDNLLNEIVQERGETLTIHAYGHSGVDNVYYTPIDSIGNFGTFGTGSGNNFNYHGKYYRFDLATSDAEQNPNVMRYDDGFILDQYINYEHVLTYNSSFPEYANESFRMSGTFTETTHTTASNQTYYYCVGVWVEIILKLK